MSFNEIWFLLIAVLFTGFFFLEGFDFGVGMAVRRIADNDLERRTVIHTIGPFWDANEVWLITAAGAMFAAFPHWYATLFSGYYSLLVLVLLALICRGVAFEFRGKAEGEGWRKLWDAAIWIGSFVPPLLLGVLFAGTLKGVPIGRDMEMNARLVDIFNGYSLLGGAVVVGLCWLHGLVFLSLRTSGKLRERARTKALRWLPWQAALLSGFAVLTVYSTDLAARRELWLILALVLGAASVLLAGFFLRRGREGWGFVMTGFQIVLLFATLFIGLFPRLMVSSMADEFALTVFNAASGEYTLRAMTVVAVVLLPFVVGYQAWSYFVFHKRITNRDHLEY
ncbi:cytochrome d ubiquinol oxidase subunit II [Cohnella cellulosilytica]|uniref:Cytochrome d ubiquinol oxidase subunit II n=1 Tax=Cohnella cellulosilytica TaxID=986710 RepID=A0ABW2FEU4_9BACL